MLRADVTVIKAVGLFSSERQGLLGTWSEIIHHSFSRRGRRQARNPPQYLHYQAQGHREYFQLTAGHFGPQYVSFFGRELFLGLDLEVRGLVFHEKKIDERPVFLREIPQIAAQADEGEQIESFLRGDNVAVAKNGIGTPDLVVQGGAVFFDEFGERVFFVLDDLSHDFLEPGDDFEFFIAERCLV